MLKLRAGEVSLVLSPAVRAAQHVIVKEEVVDDSIQKSGEENTDASLAVHTMEVSKDEEKLLGEFVSLKAFDLFTKNLVEVMEKAVNDCIPRVVSEIRKELLKNCTDGDDPGSKQDEESGEQDESEEDESGAGDKVDKSVDGDNEADESEAIADDESAGVSKEEPSETTETEDPAVSALEKAGALLRGAAQSAALDGLRSAVEKANGLVGKLDSSKKELQQLLRKAQGRDPEGDGE